MTLILLLTLLIKWALTWNWALIGNIVLAVAFLFVLGWMGACDARDKERCGL